MRRLLVTAGTALWLLAGCQAVPAPADAPDTTASCQGATPPAGAWYATIAPSEAGNDSGRTHLYASACSAVDASHPPAVTASAGDLPGGYNLVTRATGEAFLLGGSFGRIDGGNVPFVAALDARTLRQRWRTRLPGITADEWNYPGVIGVHANGDVVAVYGTHIARLDAATGAVKAQGRLPANQPARDVAYNGFVILSDGRIAAKSIHRQPGCEQPDFMAFLHCGVSGMAASTLALVDPDSLAVLQTLVAPEHLRFRVSATRLDGDELLYVPGDTQVHRFRYAGGRLSLDTHWQAPYLREGQSPGTAVAVFGEWIVVQTNGVPSRAPLSIVAISQRDAARQFRIEPFADLPRDGSFMPSMPAVDVDNARVYTFDGFAGHAAALQFDPQRGFSTAWRVPQRSFAFSALVGPPDRRVWIGTDLDTLLSRAAFSMLGYEQRLWLVRRAGTPPPEDLVWRDAATGRELGRVRQAAAVAGSVPTPGEGGSVLLPDLREARVVRVGATQQPGATP